ncbi:amino acid adenylation domain-containing protein [Variovorax sp. M-6]|uniref:amino acid adenylation domain-containing protein n=1 Tax=Variovorax sp. M-6 TaxID=3233041 RepID=UPI003F958600
MFHSLSYDAAPPVAIAGVSRDTLASLFEAQCEAHSGKLAYGFLKDDLSLAQESSYGRLLADVRSAAAWVSARTQAGDRVLLAFPPGLDFVRVFWACMLAGRVAVPVPAPDPVRLHHAAPRLRSLIADSRAALVLTNASLLDAAAATLDPATFAMARWMALPDSATLAQSEFPAFAPPGLEPDSLAYLQYTSGSTSSPRGVRLTHANVIANVRTVTAASDGDDASRSLCWLPHFHDYGLVFGILAPVIAGATGYLMSPVAFLRRPLRWLEAVATHRITHTGAPESALAACLQALGDKALGVRLDSLVSLTCGAEPIRAATVEGVLSVFGAAGLRPAAFAPSYGLAEAVLGVSSSMLDAPPRIVSADAAALLVHRFEPASDASREVRRLVGCGRAMPDTEILIVDAGRPCLDGRVGEIWARSPSIGDGYWMQPEASEAVFGGYLANGEGPYLRTGDLGFLDRGELFVTGRLKDLVIVHGENHYPQDLEWSAERAHPALRVGHCAAFPVDTPSGEAVVLALEVERRAATTDADAEAVFRAVRRAIAVEHGLPVHAVALVRAGALPRTSSGKIQRHRCREAFLANALELVVPLDSGGGELMAPGKDAHADPGERPGAVLPRDEREQAVWDIWREVLGTRAFGVHESFFELGGNSLRMTQVLSRIQVHFNVALPLAELFAHASVAAMAAQVQRQGASGGGSAAAHEVGMERQSRDVPLPASLSQRRMWVIQSFDPASTAYSVPIAIRLRGALDLALCQQALDLMVERHEGLRTAFVMGEDEPMQWIVPKLSVPIDFVDLSHLPGRERNEQARALLAHRLAQPFDLSQAPLHRPTLVRLGEREHVLFWLLHHAIIDNWAGALLMRETLAAYGALAAGRKPESAPLAIDYADYAAWQRRPESVEARRPHLAYWIERLRGLPELDLPTDFPRPAKASFKGARVSADLPLRLREAMREFGGREAVTPFVVYLSAFALMLSRQARSEDVAVGVPIANRHRFAAEQLVGTLVNTLVMRTDLAGDPSFTQLVHRVRRNALEAYAHQEAPFDELIDALGHDRTLRPEGPVRVLFNVLNAPVGKPELFGLQVDEFDFERTAAQFDLSMHIDTEFSQRIHLEYATDLYSAVSAARMLENYLALVEQLLAQPERHLSAHGMLSPAQMSLLRHGWNGTKAPLPGQLLVHRYLDLGAPEIRARVAVIDAESEEALSYGEIETRSNMLARVLRARGIARGQRVGLCIERSPAMLVAQLAVMKAGAAYVPLDPDYPAERLRFMAADADLSAVLTQRSASAILDGLNVPMLRVDDEQLTAGSPGDALEPRPTLDATPADEAYLIYTSGSTGQPKGVRVPHRSVVNFLASMVKLPGLASEDCVLATTSPSFDPSVLDLLLPLVARAKVVIASQHQVHKPDALRALLERHGVTLMQATPSAWRALIETGWSGSPGLRALVGGESLPPNLAQRLTERCGELWNIYGPTETTVWSSAWKVDAPRTGIAVGRPIDNTTVWALDEHGHACPIGVPGELCIGGTGVTLGYFRRDALTAERFVPDPFSDDAGARLYRTGDLGRWRHDGQLEHLGRTDHQVKLRGHRIEMGEIESALLDHPEVLHCVAVTRTQSEDDVRLVAYCVARGGVSPTPQALREHMRNRLPHYMIPQHFVALDAMPMLPNGKVDRASLPAPVIDIVLADGRSFVVPATHAEQVIAGIWSELLGVEKIGRTDNFFDLGGHSLLAMRSVAAIDAVLGRKIAPRRLIFESLKQIACEENLQGG